MVHLCCIHVNVTTHTVFDQIFALHCSTDKSSFQLVHNLIGLFGINEGPYLQNIIVLFHLYKEKTSSLPQYWAWHLLQIKL